MPSYSQTAEAYAALTTQVVETINAERGVNLQWTVIEEDGVLKVSIDGYLITPDSRGGPPSYRTIFDEVDEYVAFWREPAPRSFLPRDRDAILQELSTLTKRRLLWQEKADLIGSDVVRTTFLDWRLSVYLVSHRTGRPPPEFRDSRLLYQWWSYGGHLPRLALSWPTGSVGLANMDDDEEDIVDHVAAVLRDEVSEEIHALWPTCPLDRSHQLLADVALWRCPQDQRVQIPVGRLGIDLAAS